MVCLSVCLLVTWYGCVCVWLGIWEAGVEIEIEVR